MTMWLGLKRVSACINRAVGSVIMEDYQIPSMDKIKDNHWYEVYFDLEKKIEEQRDTNEKQELEIIRRTKRYQRNELEYRQ